MAESIDQEQRGAGGLLRFWWIAALVLALAPSWGTFSAPWIAEDAAILAKVSEAPLGGDFAGPQYGLHLVRFWRPVVTLSWWIQGHLTGISPLPLRLFNLALHGLSAVLIGLILRRLGAGAVTALLGAAMAASFPAQGGTVTWLAGRTDGMVAVLFLGSLLAALADRRILTAFLVLVACATKEFGFVLPAWIGLGVWAQKGRFAPALRATWPVAIVSVAALGLRRLAVGSFTGGYAGGASGVKLSGLIDGLQHGAQGLAPALLLVACLAVAGAWAGSWNWRLVLAGLGFSLCALLPLLPLLMAGPLGPQNVRLFWVVELGLILAAGGCCLHLERATGWRLALPLAVFAIGIGVRGAEARRDVLEWSDAARVGEQAVATAHARASHATNGAADQRRRSGDPGSRISPQPLLWDGFPGTHRGAYCLGFGLADRFRAPFPTSARPVWPLRPLFVQSEPMREPVGLPDGDGFRDPFDASTRLVGGLELPGIEVLLDGEAFNPTDVAASVPVDGRVPKAQVDLSPRIDLVGAPAGAKLELLLLTEAGIEGIVPGTFDQEGRASFTLTEMCFVEKGLLGAALMQTADLGATDAYLEIRALDSNGVVIAAATPMRLVWEATLLDQIDS
jgi:hypothetical protein